MIHVDEAPAAGGASSVHIRTALASDPFKGLEPFGEADAPYFFGRAREAETIEAYLIASRISLVYGQSGVGKSSLLRAGVVQRMREEARQNVVNAQRPGFVVVYFRNWRHDPIVALAQHIQRAATHAFAEGTYAASVGRDATLREVLTAWCDVINGHVLVVLDQFEDFSLYRGHEDGPSSFARQLSDAVADRRLRANFLISIREDALGDLDRLKMRIPGLFETSYRLRQLEPDAARQAIEGPIQVYNALQPAGVPGVEIEPGLVSTVLSQVTAQALRGRGLGGGDLTVDDGPIEAAYLQLVMKRIWDTEAAQWNGASGQRILRESTLTERLGGAPRIIESHLGDTMATLPRDERTVAAHMFRYLVTPTGRKIAYSATELEKLEPLTRPLQRLESVLRKLAGKPRILRVVKMPDEQAEPRYEIFHDILATGVLDWRSEFLQAAERRKRTRIALASGGVGLVVLIALSLYGLMQRQQANEAETEVRAQRYAAAAIDQLSPTGDPERALLYAMESLRVERSVRGEQVLRQALARPRLVRRLYLPGEAYQVAISPDNRFFGIASRGGPPTVYDSATAQPISQLGADAVSAKRIAFSPDGSSVATGYVDGAVRVWDARDGTIVAELGGHVGEITSIQFSPDGRRLVTTSDSSSSEPTTQPRALLWDTSSWQLVAPLTGHASGVTSAEFSVDSRLLVTSSNDGTARVWTALQGNQVGRFEQGDRVLRASFSPDGSRIVTAGGNGASVWALGAQDAVRSLSTGQLIHDAVFSPDGTKVATAGDDGLAHVYDLSDVRPSRPTLSLVGHSGPVWTVTFAHDGNVVVTSGRDGTTRVWDAQTGGVVFTMGGHTKAIASEAIEPSGDRVVSGGLDGIADVWDTSSAYPVAELKDQSTSWGGPFLAWLGNSVNAAAFSPDGSAVATAGVDGAVKLWTVESHSLTSVLPSSSGAANSVAFSGDGRRVVAAGGDGAARIWDVSVSPPAPGLVLSGSPGRAAFQATFSPDGVNLAVANGDAVRVFDATRGVSLITLQHGGDVRDVQYSRDGKLLATASWDRMVRVWDAQTGALVHTAAYGGPLNTATFGPDARTLAIAGQDTAIHIYDLPDEKDAATLRGHSGLVNGAVFSPRGTVIASASVDRSVRLWDVSNAAPVMIARLQGATGPVNGVSFSEDGGRLVAAGGDGVTRLYACLSCGDLDDLLAAGKARATRTLTPEERSRITDPNSATASADLSARSASDGSGQQR